MLEAYQFITTWCVMCSSKLVSWSYCCKAFMACIRQQGKVATYLVFLITPSVIRLNVILLNVIHLNVVMLSFILLNVFMLSVIMLSVIRLNVMAPFLQRAALSTFLLTTLSLFKCKYNISSFMNEVNSKVSKRH